MKNREYKVAGMEWAWSNGPYQKGDSCIEDLKETLESISDEFGVVDVFVGPEYFLSAYKGEFAKHPNQTLDFEQIERNFEGVRELSKLYPETLLLPGTAPIIVKSRYMGNCAPAFLNGEVVGSFFKKTDAGESELAKNNGLEYFKGDCSQNFISHKGKKLAIEICRDRGKQPVGDDTFLEMIMTYDERPGFSIRVDNDGFDRYALVVDGSNGGCDAYSFVQNANPKLSRIEPSKRSVGFSNIFNFTNLKGGNR
jgi:hypothetical protein